MKALNSRIAIGWAFVSLTFLVFAVGNIFATGIYREYQDPGAPPALEYKPKPPESCCGSLVCLMEGHHELSPNDR